MQRRDVLRATGVTALGALAGCAARVTGWSSLTIDLRNALDRPVRLRVRIAVNGATAFDRPIELGATERRSIDAPIDVPWDARLSVRARRAGTDDRGADRWRASVPLWGGNRCTIEPAIRVDSAGVQVGPICR